ncbi:MAG: hypothetical protein BWZ10_00633 [candidate division BRC1 bacterium ADurb.BinA364]|nr:MAG: hypothetical protein BWZ10_00633 [candidate division BRC1 bacterium ADurb.BinA364]
MRGTGGDEKTLWEALSSRHSPLDSLRCMEPPVGADCLEKGVQMAHSRKSVEPSALFGALALSGLRAVGGNPPNTANRIFMNAARFFQRTVAFAQPFKA